MLAYRYKPSPRDMMAGAVFFGVCTFGLAHAARTNDRGLIVNGVLEFGVEGASRFYWALAGASALFVLAAIPAFISSLHSKHQLVLGDTSLSLPRNGFARSPTVVPLASIHRLVEQQVHRQRMLTVWYSGGKITVMQSWLPDRSAFEAVLNALTAAVEGRTEA